MSFMDRRKEHLEKEIRKEGIYTIEDRSNWNHSILFFVRDSHKQYVLKFPDKGRDQKRCKKEYDVFNIVKNRKNLVHIVGNTPLNYNGSYGILMEKADLSLEDYVADLQKLDLNKNVEEESKKIILDISLGLKELHSKNVRHRDIKFTNVLLYGDTWVLSDFGESKNEDFTISYSHPLAYMSYEEFLDSHNFKEAKEVGFEEDIFSIGAVLFKLVHPQHKTPFEELQSSQQEYNFQFTSKHIDKLNVSDFTKYLLKRLLGTKAPKNAAPEELKNFRYRSITTFIDELKTKIKISESYNDVNVKKFISLNENVLSAIEEANKHRDSRLGTIQFRYIDNVIQLYEKLLNQSNQKEVKLSGYRNELIAKTSEKYEFLLENDRSIAEELLTQKNLLSDADYRKIYELAYLWGPPFTHSNRSKYGGKSRYTLEETFHCNTHYHKAMNWKKKI